MDKEPQNPESKSAEWRKNLLSLIGKTQVETGGEHVSFTSSDKKISIVHFNNGFVCNFGTPEYGYIFNISTEGFLTKVLSNIKKESAPRKVITDEEDRAEKEHLINRTLARYEKEIKERCIPQPSKSGETQKTTKEKVLETLEKREDDEPMAWSSDT